MVALIIYSVSGNAQALKHLTMPNLDHLGTIEVVVLRCYPDPAVDSPVVQAPTLPAEPRTQASPKQSARSRKHSKTPELAKPAGQPPVDESSASQLYHDMMGGLFDGACDAPVILTVSMPFGGDGGRDPPIPRQNNDQPWGYTMTSATEGVYHPETQQPTTSGPANHGVRPSRSLGHARGHFTDDWEPTEEQIRQERQQSRASQQRSPRSLSGNISRSGGGFQHSPANSEVNVENTKGWGGAQVSIPPGGPAVVINVNQPAPSVTGWGGVPDTAAPVRSRAESWANRQTPSGYGAQGQTGNGDWKPGIGDDVAWPNHGPQPKKSPYPPVDPGLELANGRWQPKRRNRSRSSGRQKAAHINRQRHSSVLTNLKMPGAWVTNDNQQSDTPSNVNGPTFQTQATNWVGGDNNPKNTGGRYYGSDTGSNGNAQGWGQRDINNNNEPTNWNNPISSADWKNGNTQNDLRNSQQATPTAWPPFRNSLAQNTPVHSSPNVPIAKVWAQPPNSPTQVQVPLPPAPPPPPRPPAPQQPSAPVNNQAQTVPAEPSHEAPATAHTVIPSVTSNVKPYWAAWNRSRSPPTAEQSNTSRKRSDSPSYVYVVDEEPLYSVPEDVAAQKKASHQVQPGPGALYVHKVHTPRYMDSMEEPYAVFVFKYRSKGSSPQG